MRRLTPRWPTIASPEQAGPFVCGVGWCPVGGSCGGGVDCAVAQNRLTNLWSRLVS